MKSLQHCQDPGKARENFIPANRDQVITTLEFSFWSFITLKGRKSISLSNFPGSNMHVQIGCNCNLIASYFKRIQTNKKNTATEVNSQISSY